MRFLIVIRTLTLLFFLAATTFLRADTIFDVSGYMPNYGNLSGTVTINTSTGTVSSAIFNLPGISMDQDLYVYPDGVNNQATEIQVNQNFNDFLHPFVIDIGIPVQSLVGYAGGELCSTDSTPDVCAGILWQHGQALDLLEYGSLEPATSPSTVPEPSTFALMSTGLLAAFGMVRHKRNV
jgi:hypothetical protein